MLLAGDHPDMELMHRMGQAPRGQGLVEYALLISLVALVAIVVLSLVGPAVGNIYSNVVDNLNRSSELAMGGNPGGNGNEHTGGDSGSYTGGVAGGDASDDAGGDSGSETGGTAAAVPAGTVAAIPAGRTPGQAQPAIRLQMMTVMASPIAATIARRSPTRIRPMPTMIEPAMSAIRRPPVTPIMMGWITWSTTALLCRIRIRPIAMAVRRATGARILTATEFTTPLTTAR